MSLRLLVDEHVGGNLYSRLDGDFQLTRVVDALGPQTRDTDIWRYAVEHELLVFTNDRDFVTGDADPDTGTHPGVIKYTGSDWKRLHQAMLAVDATYTHRQIRTNGYEVHIPGSWA